MILKACFRSILLLIQGIVLWLIPCRQAFWLAYRLTKNLIIGRSAEQQTELFTKMVHFLTESSEFASEHAICIFMMTLTLNTSSLPIGVIAQHLPLTANRTILAMMQLHSNQRCDWFWSSHSVDFADEPIDITDQGCTDHTAKNLKPYSGTEVGSRSHQLSLH